MAKTYKPKNHEDWLDVKRKTIGGSEVASLCNLNPYQSPRDIFMLKTGRTDYEEPNYIMKLGIHLEDGVANLWEDISGNRVIKSSANDIIYFHDEYDFLTGTLDRRYFRKEGGKGVLEIKTTNGIFDYSEVPQNYLIQLQWYLGISGMDTGTIAWFEFRTRELKYQEYKFDKDLFDSLVDLAVDFHQNNILADVEPDISTVSDVNNKFSKEEEGKSIEATEDIQNCYSELKELSHQKKSFEEKINSIKDTVKMVMLDAEKISYVDEILFTWKANKNGNRVFKVK